MKVTIIYLKKKEKKGEGEASSLFPFPPRRGISHSKGEEGEWTAKGKK